MSGILYREDEVPADWKLLASVDESASYEVDMAEIWKTPTGYALLTASGCSCWSGEYEKAEFASLELLGVSLMREDRTYNPSLRGALNLLAEAVTADCGAKA